jgi:hypothetical protein
MDNHEKNIDSGALAAGRRKREMMRRRRRTRRRREHLEEEEEEGGWREERGKEEHGMGVDNENPPSGSGANRRYIVFNIGILA